MQPPLIIVVGRVLRDAPSPLQLPQRRPVVLAGYRGFWSRVYCLQDPKSRAFLRSRNSDTFVQSHFTATRTVMLALPTFVHHLLADNIRPLFCFLPCHWLRGSTRTLQPSSSTRIMEPLSLAAYRTAVKNCRSFHCFFFFDLPRPVRLEIYRHFFSNNTIQVCSFAKEYEGEFGENERCQLLLTSKRTFREACNSLYFYTRWKFVSVSALSYFTWHDVRPCYWKSVKHITLTNLDAVVEFGLHEEKFANLHTLIIDTPDHFPIRARRRPRKTEQQGFVRAFVERRDFQYRVHPYIYFDRDWKVCITATVDYGRGDKEASFSEEYALPY